ncbi:hypothetical protein [Micromonospora rubida]
MAGEPIRRKARDSVRVADRFHLWQKLGQAVEKTVNAYRSRLIAPAPPPADDTMPAEVQPLPEKKIVTRLREHHTAVHQLAAQGLNRSAIGRKLGLHRATVRKYLNASSVAELTAVTEQRAHLVDDYVAYLHQRWNAGERNATQLFRVCDGLKGLPEVVKNGWPQTVVQTRHRSNRVALDWPGTMLLHVGMDHRRSSCERQDQRFSGRRLQQTAVNRADTAAPGDPRHLAGHGAQLLAER